MATWPDTLPAPQGNYSSTEGCNGIMRRGQSGRLEIRRYGSAAPSTGSYRWSFTESQKEIFDRFYRVDLNLGINWFSAPWIALLGYPAHKARIVGYVPYTGQTSGRFDYAMTLLIKKASACPVDDIVWPVGV